MSIYGKCKYVHGVVKFNKVNAFQMLMKKGRMFTTTNSSKQLYKLKYLQ